MTITSQIDQSGQLTTHIATGEISSTDIIRVIESFYKENPTKNIIWNFRDADTDALLSLSYNELKDIVRFTKQHEALRRSGKTALVVSTDLAFGLGRMYDTLAEIENLSHSVKVFRSMDEAIKWLEGDE
ncbi:MAG: hypothetical protein KJ687_06290 [Proteobacteria bacterium]|nr:hypothetical protein [Pseudomonadota bacterium]